MSIDLNGLAPGAISQTFPTIVNDTYFVTFKLAGNPDNATNPAGAPAIKALDRRGHRQRDEVLFVRRFGHVARRYGLDGYGLHVRSQGFQHDYYLHLEERRRLRGLSIDNVVVTETAATGASCKNGGWKTMVDKDVDSVQEPGRLRQLLRDRREEPRKLGSSHIKTHHHGSRPAPAGGAVLCPATTRRKPAVTPNVPEAAGSSGPRWPLRRRWPDGGDGAGEGPGPTESAWTASLEPGTSARFRMTLVPAS